MLAVKQDISKPGRAVKSKLPIAFAITIGCVAAAALAGETIGVVKRSTGHVMIERGAEQLPAGAGMEVLRGDRLLTGADGYATINMHGAFSLSVGANSAVPLDRYAPEELAVARAGSSLLQRLAAFFALNRQR